MLTCRRAFTLIELLVVIAIIAILAAILFPVFARTRESARVSVCNSNLRQLGIAAHMYAQDYDEWFPCDYYPCNSSLTHMRLVRQITPYVKNMQIMYCPSVTRISQWLPDFDNTPANQAAGNISYYYYSFDQVLSTVTPPRPSWSTWICWGFLPGRGVTGPRVMSEMWDTNYWLWTDGWCKLTRDTYGVNIHQSHAGSINICYLDGHVKFQGGEAQAVFR
ncbi:MAG: DUF1559 domain-containing protein [Armatimonadetes bacterium]|nr:DUF1559 domain-containing protein [Armatimonadota bacterium]